MAPRNVDDVTDSDGLLGRSSGTSDTGVSRAEGNEWGSGKGIVGLRGSRRLGETLNEVAELLIAASRRRRSSNGAGVIPAEWSMLIVR